MKGLIQFSIFLCLGISPMCVNAQEVQLKISKPLSAQDKAEVESLLKGFDPNTYSFSSSYVAKSGKTETMKLGSAKGLADVKMSNTKVLTKPGASVAGTVTNNNVFKASTVTNNNIFKASTVTNNNIFKASTVTNNNIFKASTVTNNNVFKVSDVQAGKLNQLHQILSKYQ